LYNYFGIKIEAEHHEVATSGQCEINLVYDEMITMADNVIAVKNLVKVKAKRKNKVATFYAKTNFLVIMHQLCIHIRAYGRKLQCNV
jgi:L-glutamine synthetase (EC 6.3.1.2)